VRHTSDPVLRAAVRQHLLEEIASGASRSKESSSPAPGSRWVSVVATALVLVVVIAGSVLAIRAGQASQHRSTPAQHTSPTPTPRAPKSMFDGAVVTAVGTLTGAAAGSVRVTSRAGGDFTIEIDVTHVDGLQGRQVELATSLADVDCPLTNDSDRSRVIDFGVVDLSKPATLDLPPLDKTYGNFSGDLSYMPVLVLRPNGGGDSSEDYCTPSKMGVADLSWTRPAAYLSVHAVDHGEAPAARGVVHERGGHPVSYDVAPDDQLASVAARFGLTAGEVLYLNPRRTEPSSTMLYADETLNLDTNDR
jgi:hypothetical protein